MSYRAIEWAIKPRLRGDVYGKAVLFELAFLADDAGALKCKLEEVASVTEMSVRTVRNKFRVLETAGLVETCTEPDGWFVQLQLDERSR
jgi:predicted transcriptional regulator